MNMKYKPTFYYIISLLWLACFIIVLIVIVGCSQPVEYDNTIVSKDVIEYSDNFIKLQSYDIVVLNNGHGHPDKWFIKEGVTFELIIHEVDDYVRLYNTPDFILSPDRIYTVGEGRDHVTDFTALNPPVDYYYFTIEIIINGVSTTTDYVIDSIF